MVAEGHLEILETEGRPVGAVLVIPSWWGLTASFRHYGAALAKAGFAVGLADPFGGRVAGTEAEARALRARRRRVPMYRSLAADLEAMRGAGPPVSVVGFSMGGHWAVWLAQRPEYRVARAVLYYAARGGSFAACRARFLAHFAEEDQWVSASARAGMERALGRAGCGYRSHDYPGTGHWFAESGRPEHDAGAARLALTRDIAFLRGLSDG